MNISIHYRIVLRKLYLYLILFLTVPLLIVLVVYIYKDTITDRSEGKELQELIITSPSDIHVDENRIFVSSESSNIIRVYEADTNKNINNISTSSADNVFSPNHLTLDPNRDILYADNSSASGLDDIVLAGIDLKSNRLIVNFSHQNFSDITGSSFRINDMAFDKGRDKLYLTSNDALIEIDAKTHKIRYNVFENEFPPHIIASPRGIFLYILNDSDTLSVIDTERLTILNPPIEVGMDAADVTLNNANNLIYVVNEDANRVSIVNRTTNTLMDTLFLITNSSDLGNEPPYILANPNLNKIYISDSDGNAVIVIDAITQKEIKSIPVSGPQEMEINEMNNFIYVKNWLSDSISIIDGNRDVLIKGRVPYQKEAGIQIIGSPEDAIAINSRTNLVYVGGTGHVSVIDGKTDRVLTTLSLGQTPVGVAVNEATNTIYTSNCLDNTLSIINGNTSEIINASIPVPGIGCSIVADERSGDILFFISDGDDRNLFIMNSTDHLSRIGYPFDTFEFDFDIEPSLSTLYVADGDYVYAFNPDTQESDTIEGIGQYPRNLIINPSNALIYVVNQNSHTVSVIDKYSNKVIKEIPVGTFPSSIALNKKTNMLFVANEHSDTVSVIDGTTNSVVDTIQVGNFPMGVAVNPTTNVIYVTNADSNTISVIDGNTREVFVGINYNISPVNSGQLLCNGKKIVNASYIRYNLGTAIECEAIPNKGFVTGLWSGNVITDTKSVSADTTSFKIDGFRNLTANFEESTSVDLNIPFETLVQILLIVVAAVIGWLIPGIVGFLSKLRQKSKIISFMNSINDANKEEILETLRKEISGEYARGKISSANYEILKNRIKERNDVL